ncbi:MAG: type II secretion system protein [Patescibacteria group bacterium]
MKNFQKGQSLVELLLVIGLSAIILPALLTGLVTSREGRAQQGQRAQAITVLNQTIEGVRSVREKGWSYIDAVPIGIPYHPEISSPTWTLSPGEYTDPAGFKTKVVINSVNRGVCPGPDCGTIVTTGGVLDPSTKKVDVTISWVLPNVSSVSDTLYMTRYLDNNSFIQTTEADFNAGTKTGTTVTNTAGGEVTLGAGGHGDWCSPNLSINPLDLPKQGVANAVTAIEGRAFAGTGDNASGESFVNINISNTDPPVASILGTFDSIHKTNDIFGETNYGYIATDTNDREIVIIDLTAGPYSEIGRFNAPGVTNANSVFIVGNTGYMTQGSRLRNFDLTSCSGGNRTGSCPAIDPDGAAISATGTSVVVSGTYAFVSIAGHARELEIFDLINPANIVRVGWADVNGEAATDVFMNATASRAYIVTNASATLPEFFIINTENKNCSDCPDIGSYNAGTSVNLKAVEVVPGGYAIIIGQGGEEYQVVKVSPAFEANPVKCGGMQIDSGAKDSASVLEADGDAYSYIVTGDVNAEFKIIEGGPGGAYASSGEFVSSTFDPGYITAFNRFDVSLDRPVNSDIKFQVAVEDAIMGSCSGVGFTFVGPGATSSDFFVTTQTTGVTVFNYSIPGSINPGRCFRYKSYFSTSDFTSTPVFHDMILNYSP